MSYLLDTKAVVAILRDRPPAVRQRYRAARNAGTPVAVSSIVWFELWYGVAKSSQPSENTERMLVLRSGGLDIHDFDDADAQAAGRIRASLERAGTPIGAYDVLIAGQALRRGLTVVTANTSEFGRVDGLQWEDWTD